MSGSIATAAAGAGEALEERAIVRRLGLAFKLLLSRLQAHSTVKP
jgi:hypothetical protein